MDSDEWDDFEAAIAELTFGESVPFETAIRQLCELHLNREASVLLLASISYATHVDHFLSVKEPNSLRASIHRYRVVAALSADVALLPPSSKRCIDLLNFWAKSGNWVFLPKKVPKKS
ncbi:MAG: hypothetical protein ACI9PY_002672 [Ascidiaceihabitans sp.]|jgi:hypothetical protein